MMKSLAKNRAITFVIPDVTAFQSGGNIYNKNLIDGLKKNGQSIEVLDWAAFSKVTAPLEGYYFFDTLYFRQLKKFLPQKAKNASCYLIVHHLESLYPPKDWTADAYFKQKEYPILKLFDGFLTSSQFTAAYLTKHHLNAPKIIIPPAINFQTKKTTETAISKIQVVMVANLVERKGVLPFLQLLASTPFLQQTQNLQLHLIGTSEIEPDYAQACLQLIEKNPSLKKIIYYHGQLSPTQVHSFYQKANLFISTAFMETYGMALQEARAFQLPILALKGGNVENHVENGRTGWLFDKMEDLVQQLANLVKQGDDLSTIQENILHQTTTDFYDWAAAAKDFIRQLAYECLNHD